jgi:hypothetical protein
MAGISHAARSLQTAVMAVLLVALLAILTAVTLAVTARDSGGSPSKPTPVARNTVALVENCAWRRNGWYC